MTRGHTWRTHLREYAGTYIVAFVVVLVVLLAAQATWRAGRQWVYDRQPLDEWVTDYRIRYAGEDPDGRAGQGAIQFTVQRNVHVPVRLSWSDRLICRGPTGVFDQYVSVQESGIRAEPGFFSVTFDYRGDYPVGRECVLRSDIDIDRAGVVKSLTVESDVFTVAR